MILLIDTVSVLIGATISIVILACISILATLLAKQMLKYEKIKKPSEQNVSKPQNIEAILKTFPFAERYYLRLTVGLMSLAHPLNKTFQNPKI
jgi:hypothetical protein